MIGRIHGQLVEVCDSTILLDAGGIAYEVEVTSSVLATLPAPDGPLKLYTHLVVREDAQLLYGFGSRDERDLFRALIRINGVGPKMGLALISTVSTAELARSVRDNDTSALTKVAGVGRKTAERSLVELKNRGLEDLAVVAEPHGHSADREAVVEAQKALLALGYKAAEAQQAVEAIATEGASTEQLVTAVLKRAAQLVEATS